MGKSPFFVFTTATRNEPATARLFSISFIWTSVQIFRVLGMSCAVFLWNFFSFENLSKCFRPDQRVRFEGWPGAFFFSFISNSSSIFGKLKRHWPPNRRTFSPRPEFFQISEDLWKAPSPTGVVFTTSTDSYPSYPPRDSPVWTAASSDQGPPKNLTDQAQLSRRSTSSLTSLQDRLDDFFNGCLSYTTPDLCPLPPDSLCTDLA